MFNHGTCHDPTINLISQIETNKKIKRANVHHLQKLGRSLDQTGIAEGSPATLESAFIGLSALAASPTEASAPS